VLLLGALLGGCSGIEVSRDYDPRQDFSTMRTWAWAPSSEADVEEPGSLVHGRVRLAVESELLAKGYPRVDAEEADMWVRPYAALGQRIEAEPAYDYRWHGRELRVYDEGTIVIDMVAAKDHRLVWRGSARGAVDVDATPEEREARVRHAVREILEEFPPERRK
jgi:hypothetical protein